MRKETIKNYDDNKNNDPLYRWIAHDNDHKIDNEDENDHDDNYEREIITEKKIIIIR